MRSCLPGLVGILLFSITNLRAEEIAINAALAEYGACPKQSVSSCRDLNMNCYSARPVWTSRHSNEPQWIVVDMGSVRKIFKIVVSHEAGQHTTSDFAVQGSMDADGPWRDLAEPVVNNKDQVTTHEFAPTDLRYIRVFITKAYQQGEFEKDPHWKGTTVACIKSIDAYTKREFLKEPLLGLKSVSVNYAGDETKEDIAVSLIMPGKSNSVSCELSADGREFAKFTDWDGLEKTFTLTSTGYPVEIRANISDGKQQWTVNRSFNGMRLGHFRQGKVFVFSSSHQDIAWMLEPNECIKYRDEKVITPALEIMKTNLDYHYDMETTMLLMEYLERHPERRDEVVNLTKQGRFSWGATYTQPFESSYGSESAVRSTYLGRKWIKNNLPGCDSTVAWNLDVPGRSMQMPQILAKAGIKYLLFSRYAPGLYKWYSPDGSNILAYSTGGYPIQKCIMQSADTNQVKVGLTNSFYYWSPYYEAHNIAPIYGLQYTDDFMVPKDFGNLINPWNQECKNLQMPTIEYATAEKFFREVDVDGAKFDVLNGERPNLWLYEMPSHCEAMLKAREAGRVLPAAETFAAINTAINGNFAEYPQAQFENAWKKAIFADHGWGGNGQEVTDRLFYENFASAAQTGRQILNKNLNEIASQVATKSDCIPVVVFNPLSWPRTDIVVSEVYSPDKSCYEWQLEDGQGGKVDWQVVPGNNKKDSLGFTFVAQQVPSFGYKVYYLRHIKPAVAWNEDGDQKPDFAVRNGDCTSFENKYYSVEFAAGGIKKLYDKELQSNIADCNRLMFGELFAVQSVGFGDGEQDEITKVTLDGFEKLGSYNPKWSCKEDGPVKTVYEITQKMKNCTAVQRVTFYAQIKRIDCEVSLLGWDGSKYREFRLAFPVNGSSNDKVLYEVPMGIVEVGKDEIKNSGGYSACKDVHPREVQDWFATYNEHTALTISSDASAFDWVNPLEPKANAKMLQPVLLSSRRSCHPAGSWYLQTGDHNYSFSIFSHKPNRIESMRSAKSAAFPMIAVVNPKRNAEAKLPEVLSFCEINNSNAIVSAFKKCEDDNSYIVRCYDFEGVSSNANMKLFRPIKTLVKTNLIEETDQNSPSQSDIKINAFGIETYKITLE